MDLNALQQRIASHAASSGQEQSATTGPTQVRQQQSLTASERVMAAELEARGDAPDALSMMVSSIARMVQAGKTRDSRWKAS
ncbi:MAG: hypothetical protein ACKO6F_08580 [Cyanobium sp.]